MEFIDQVELRERAERVREAYMELFNDNTPAMMLVRVDKVIALLDKLEAYDSQIQRIYELVEEEPHSVDALTIIQAVLEIASEE